MNNVRAFAFNLTWGLWTALFGLTIPVVWIARSPPQTVRLFSRVWARGVLALLSTIMGLGYIERGRDQLLGAPGLIVSNHQSTWETLAALVLFPDVAIISKRELLRIPVMGWFLKHSPMIVIDRSSAATALREMMEQSRAALAAGRSVLIFPEGTRKPVAEPIEFKRGVELLYRMLGVPVTPMVVNSGVYWGIGGARMRPGAIVVSFMPPIQPGLGAAEFSRVAQTLMESEKIALAREAGGAISEAREATWSATPASRGAGQPSSQLPLERSRRSPSGRSRASTSE